jgi:hypothetical protein
MSKGPVLTPVQALSCVLALPTQAETRCCRVACDISQRAKPDVRPLKPRGLCIYCGEDAPPAHHADRRCALSAFNVSCPLRWQATPGPFCRRRTCPVRCQTVRPCRAAHYAHHPLYEKLPLHVDTMQISDVRAREGCSSGERL